MTEPLRDLKKNTELLILVRVLEDPAVKLRDVSEGLGITTQAVSQYLSAMRKEGIVKEQKGRLRPTRKGMQILQEHFGSLKSEVDAILRRIMVVDSCTAIAAKDFKKGDKIGLVMEDGMLMAYSDDKSSSKGIAMEPASIGDDILVGRLEGIVDMKLGTLVIIETPSELDGGSKKADIDRARLKIESLSPGLLVAGDLVGSALLAKATPEYFVIHAPVESAMSALTRGVDVVFCGTHESMDQMMHAIATLRKETGYSVQWSSIKV
ncbi:MAG: winged helix-turn-helix transcriptional regulator [Methanobacteriota archaeon]|nr:MAG: winged helix-turn-helix transcriptional regulator [Euryarchaeota archaeon]